MNWDLSKLYQGFENPAFAADMRALEADVDSAEEVLKLLPEDEAQLLHAFVVRLQEIMDLYGKLQTMVFFTLAANSVCEAALAPRMRLLQLGNQLELLKIAFTA